MISIVDVSSDGGGTYTNILAKATPKQYQFTKNIASIAGKNIIVRITTKSSDPNCAGSISEPISVYVPAIAVTVGINLKTTITPFSGASPVLIAGGAILLVIIIIVIIVAS